MNLGLDTISLRSGFSDHLPIDPLTIAGRIGNYNGDNVQTTGALIDQWDDLSGNGNDLVSTVAREPTSIATWDGHGAGLFGGAHESLAAFAFSGDITVFMVMDILAIDSVSSDAFYDGFNILTSSFGINANGNVKFVIDGTNTIVEIYTNILNNRRIYSFSLDGNDSFLRENLNPRITGNLVQGNYGGIRLGGFGASFWGEFECAELHVYNSILSEQTQDGIIRFLLNKYPSINAT